MSNTAKTSIETLDVALGFNRIALFAYSRRCAILRKQMVLGLITYDQWNTARFAVDHAASLRFDALNTRIDKAFNSK